MGKQVVTQVGGWLEENGDTAGTLSSWSMAGVATGGSLLMDRSVLLAAIVQFGKQQI